MGLSGISLPQLIVIFLIAALLFGTHRLRQMGTDLGSALRSFKKALQGQDPDPKDPMPFDDMPKSPKSQDPDPS